MEKHLVSFIAGIAGAALVLIGVVALESKADPPPPECQQWEARMVRISSDGETVPEGWEPYGYMYTNMGKDYVGVRRCLSR